MKTNSKILIIILFILLFVGSVVLVQSGVVKRIIDPCERVFTDCNHGCGEGILSSICKEKCSYDYRICEDG